jgi:hypothetical protein
MTNAWTKAVLLVWLLVVFTLAFPGVGVINEVLPLLLLFAVSGFRRLFAGSGQIR